MPKQTDGFRHSLSMECGDDQFTIIGPQIHSSTTVRMTCKHRGDGGCARFHFSNQSIDATGENIVRENVRGLTAVGNERIRVEQIEHVLSALSGMGYLDTDIHLDYVSAELDTAGADQKGEEAGEDRRGVSVIAPPVAFLSALDFTAAIARSFHSPPSVGRVRIDRRYTISANSNDDSALAVFTPHSEFYVTVVINYANFLGKQAYSCTVEPENYARRISWARSFFSTNWPHKAEMEELKKQFPGLIRGQKTHYRSIMLDYQGDRWLTPPYASDEPARHKLLDVVGDLALLGAPLQGAVFVYKPYHEFNRKCVSVLGRQLQLWT